MDAGTFVARESDVANLARFLGLKRRFHASAGGEDAFGIGHADDFVKLQEIDIICLESAQRFLNLPRGGFLVTGVDLRHQESSLAIAVEKCLAHAKLAVPLVVVPAVVEKVESIVDCGANDAKAFGLLDVRPGEVIST